MGLRASKPKIVEPSSQRLKFMMYAFAGVGKTTAALQMPKPYIIDTENGTSFYGDIITKSGGAVFQTTDMHEAIAEVKALMTTKHSYRTLVIDSFTPIYEMMIEEGIDKVGDVFGKHIAYADRYSKHLFRLLTSIDMNVVVTSHAKEDWNDGKRVGIKFDGWKKLDYLFDLVLELERRGKTDKRTAVVRKTRISAFPDQESFEWSFKALAERIGVDSLEREATTIPMATAEQVENLEKKVKALNIPAEEVQKWLSKAECDSFSEMTEQVILKCIAFCDKKLKEAE